MKKQFLSFAILLCLSCEAQQPESLTARITFGINTASPHLEKSRTDFHQPFHIDAEVSSMLQDSLGNLWMATSAGKLLRFQGGPLQYYTSPDFKANHISSMLSNRGHLWLSTNEGLFYIKDDDFFKFESELKDMEIHDLHQTDVQTILIATSAGLYQIEEQNEMPELIPIWSEGEIKTIVKGSEQAYFLIEHLGLCKWSNGKMKTLFNPKGGIRALASDNQEFIWATDHKGILYRMNKGQVKTFDLPELRNVEVEVLHVDSRGRLWIGTPEHGAFVFDGTYISHIGKAEGLPLNKIKVLFTDFNGNLWIGGDKGLFRLDAPYPGEGC